MKKVHIDQDTRRNSLFILNSSVSFSAALPYHRDPVFFFHLTRAITHGTVYIHNGSGEQGRPA
ncbi:hypothetical protein [Psychromonas ingrahamii]|uniref:hypothetical protein n=1 Tax=Psychromonas ingrahamii TaxID=357794 RepID=UPI0002FE5A06|nr:hypothetical protein [Psychromonas ingrahamii]